MATEVGSAYVSIIPSAAGFGAELRRLLASEMATVTRQITGSLGDAAAAGGRQGGQELGHELARGADSGIRTLHTELVTEARTAGAAAGNAAGQGITSGVNSGVKRAIGLLGTLGGAGLATAAAKIGIQTAAGLEQAQIGFETLIGDAGRAKTFLGDLSKFAAATPFELPGLIDSSRTLLGVGMSADKVIPTLTAFGDAAGAVGVGQDSFQRIMLATSQAVSAGKFATEDLNQITENGIPVWKVLSEAMGKPVPELRDLASGGKLLASDVLPLLQTQMEKDYGGAMARQSQTLAGVWSTLKDSIAIGLADSFKPLVPMLSDLLPKGADLFTAGLEAVAGGMKGVVEGTSAVVGWLREHLNLVEAIGTPLAALAITIGAVALAMKAWAIAQEAWTAITTFATAVQTAWNASIWANPIGLIVLALIALAAGLVVAYRKVGWFRDFVDAAWKQIAAAANWLWETVLKPIFTVWWAYVKMMAGIYLWLWNNALKPALEGIGAAATWLWNTVLKPLFTAWWGFAQVMGQVYLWLWNNVVSPALIGIGAAASWLWASVLKPIFTAWWGFAQVMGQVYLWLWNNVLAPAFAGIGAALSWLWSSVLQPVFTAWWGFAQVMGQVYLWLWNNVIKPAFDGIGAVIGFVWNNVIMPVFTAIHWWISNVVGPVFSWLYDNVIKPVWAGIKLAIEIAWAAIQIVWGAIQIYVKILGAVFSWLYDTVIKPVWNGISAVISWAWTNVIMPIFEAVKIGVNVVGAVFSWLYENAIAPAWEGIKTAVSGAWDFIKGILSALGGFITDTVYPAFQRGVDAIGRAWDTVKDLARKPIEFVVLHVINPFIRGFNTIAKKFGVSEVAEIGGFGEQSTASAGRGTGGRAGMVAAAAGGHIRGPGTGTSDSIAAWLSNGEYVIPANVVSSLGVGFFNRLIGRPSASRPGDGSEGIAFAAGGLVGKATDLLGKIPGIGDAVKVLTGAIGGLDHLPGVGFVRDIIDSSVGKLIGGGLDLLKSKIPFFGGGGGGYAGPISADVASVQGWLRAQAGKPYVWAAAGPGGYDCSGLVSAVWNLLRGRNPYSHTFSTHDEAGYFPKTNQWGVLTAGWANSHERGGGSVGHTTGNLAGVPFESRGSRGVIVGGDARPVTGFAHWGTFDRGGMLVPGQAGINLTRHPEAVLDPVDTAAFHRLAANADELAGRRDEVHYHLSGVGPEGLRQLEARQARRDTLARVGRQR